MDSIFYGVERTSGTDPFALHEETLGLYGTPQAACEAIDAFTRQDEADGFRKSLEAEGYVRLNKDLGKGETMLRAYSIYIQK